jgi:glutaredoxin
MGFRFAVLALLGVVTLASAQTTYRWVDKDGRVQYSDRPPPADAKNPQEKRFGSPNFVESGPSYALRRAQQDYPVTLYTAAGCDAECKRAREFLSRRGVPFAETVLKSADESAQYRQAFGGEQVFVPALIVGSQKQKGFEDGAWTRLLDAAGYPKTAQPGATPSAAQPAPKAQ